MSEPDVSESAGRGAIFRAIGWLGVGLFLALAGAAAITPVGAYDFSVIAPMLGIVAVGTAVTLYAGFKGERAAEDHRQLRRMDAADAADGASGDHTAGTAGTGNPSDSTDHGQDD